MYSLPEKDEMTKGSLKDRLRRVSKRKLVLRLRPELLLGSNVPRPMHGVAPRVILGSRWWNQERQAAYRSTKYHCLACGVWKHQALGRDWLEGHETYDIDYLKGQMVYVETVPLCHYCHNFIHDGRMRSLLAKGKLTHQKFTAIVQHGDSVLFAAKLSRARFEDREDAMADMILNGEVAPWPNWRLVLFGNKYPPKFKTELQWQKAMSR